MADLVTRLLLNSSNFDNNIRKSTQQIQQFQRNVQTMGNTFNSSWSAMGKMAAFAGIGLSIGAGLKYAVDTSIQFEKSLSSLRSLTGVTTKELEYFKQEAIRLGSTSTQTASQVVEAFKLIGSQMPELLKSKEALTQVTEQAIVLAEAAQIEVPEAAKALTGALNQMGESSYKAGDYINILAAASQKGSADIPYLNAAIEKAGGTASSVGVRFNELVAAIEAIAPKISEAGSAGTNLRNIFLTLESSTDKNLKPSVVGFSKALENLSKKQYNVTELTKMFGKESVTAALAIINQKDQYLELTKSITDTNTAYEQQKINNDNVAGAVSGLKSAWEGFTLSVNNTNGKLKETIDSLTGIINYWKEALMSKDEYYQYQVDNDSKFHNKETVNRLNSYKDKGMTSEEAVVKEKAQLKGYSDYDPEVHNKEIKNLQRLKEKYGELNETGAERLKYLIREKAIYEGQINTINSWAKEQEDASKRGEEAKKKEAKAIADAAKEAAKAAAKIPKDGSIAKLDKEISAKRTELNMAVNDNDRIRINRELDELVEKKRIIEFHYKFPDAPTQSLDDKRGGVASLAKLPTEITKIENPIKKDDVKITNDYVDSLNAVANAMSAVNTANIEGAAGWISWAGSMMTATAVAIDSIRKVVAAKTAEAAASGAAEAAKTPIVGWLMVGGAIASVLAAMTSIPSFSTGGIFAGNNTVGDMNLARVNAGEMILNNRQQKNLFNILNGNTSNGSNNNNQVTFKIKGSDLVGTLSNYNTRLNKIR